MGRVVSSNCTDCPCGLAPTPCQCTCSSGLLGVCSQGALFSEGCSFLKKRKSRRWLTLTPPFTMMLDTRCRAQYRFWSSRSTAFSSAGRSEEHTSELQSHSDLVC